MRTRQGFLNLRITEILDHRFPIVKASHVASSHRMAETIPSSPVTAIKKVLQIFPNIPWRVKLSPLRINGLTCQLHWDADSEHILKIEPMGFAGKNRCRV